MFSTYGYRFVIAFASMNDPRMNVVAGKCAGFLVIAPNALIIWLQPFFTFSSYQTLVKNIESMILTMELFELLITITNDTSTRIRAESCMACYKFVLYPLFSPTQWAHHVIIHGPKTHNHLMLLIGVILLLHQGSDPYKSWSHDSFSPCCIHKFTIWHCNQCAFKKRSPELFM